MLPNQAIGTIHKHSGRPPSGPRSELPGAPVAGALHRQPRISSSSPLYYLVGRPARVWLAAMSSGRLNRRYAIARRTLDE
jgi:hypothetical protein